MSYIHLVSNIARRLSAWVTVAVFSMVLNGYLVAALIAQSASQPVRLVPCSFDRAEGPMTVTATGENSPEYNTLMAIGDIMLLNNWQPSNVKTNFGWLLNRMTPEMYAAYSAQIVADAERYAQGAASRSFYITSTAANTENKVEIVGELREYEASQVMLAETKRYLISYRYVNGIPLLDGIEETSGGRQR